jgi:hypothetical protein
LRPSRATGAAPMTCAIVMLKMIGAPPRESPVSGIASRAKAMGPAACGRLNVPYANSHRTSDPGPIVPVRPTTLSEGAMPVFNDVLTRTSSKCQCRKADRGIAAGPITLNSSQTKDEAVPWHIAGRCRIRPYLARPLSVAYYANSGRYRISAQDWGMELYIIRVTTNDAEATP